MYVIKRYNSYFKEMKRKFGRYDTTPDTVAVYTSNWKEAQPYPTKEEALIYAERVAGLTVEPITVEQERVLEIIKNPTVVMNEPVGLSSTEKMIQAKVKYLMEVGGYTPHNIALALHSTPTIVLKIADGQFRLIGASTKYHLSIRFGKMKLVDGFNLYDWKFDDKLMSVRDKKERTAAVREKLLKMKQEYQYRNLELSKIADMNKMTLGYLLGDSGYLLGEIAMGKAEAAIKRWESDHDGDVRSERSSSVSETQNEGDLVER